MARKIITLTLNTSIDVSIEIPAIVDNSVVDASSYSTMAGGKGVNVARVLGILGERVIALGIVGRNSGEPFSTLSSQLMSTDFVYVDGESRKNTTIFQTERNSVTHIRGKGFKADRRSVGEVKRKLNDYADKGDIVVLAGSLPPGADKNLYGELIELIRSRGALPVLDTSGDSLKIVLDSKPFMIKPNILELQSALGVPAPVDDAAVVGEMRKLVDGGISYVAVSLGSGGAFVISKENPVPVRARIDLGAEYAGVKPVGSGDAMVAGFIYGIKNDLEYFETVRWGVACGAANAIRRMIDSADLSRVTRLKEQVRIQVSEDSR